MNNLFRLACLLGPVIGGLWIATQKFAALLQYDGILGIPFILQGQPYYLPWKYLSWYFSLHLYIPELFKHTNLYAFGGFIVGLLLLLLVQPPRRLDSHGSAHWGAYEDILNMELISAGGVVVGLYDNAFVRGLTSFVRSVDKIKKEKVSFAEMDYDKRLDKKRDQLMERLLHLQGTLTAETAEPKKLQTAIGRVQKKLDLLPDYDARRENPFTVYPWVWFHKKLFQLYLHCPHFYLRDNSNKHLAVIAPTRTGKGVGLIIPTLLGGWKASVIVNDIKSENWGITAGYRKRMGQKVIKFEPTADDGSSARWNPLDEIPIGNPEEVSGAQNLAYILADYEGKGKLDHWGSNAATVIMVVILHLRYAHFADPGHYPSAPTLYSVASFLKANIVPMVDETGNPVMEYCDEEGNVYDKPHPNCKEQQKVNAKGFLATLKELQNFEHVPDEGIRIREWDKVQEKYVEREFDARDLKAMYPLASSLDYIPNTHPIIYQNFVDILSKPENECGSIISTANTALKEYLDPILAKNTIVSDFCIDDLMNYKKPVSLYLVTPPSDLLRLAPIFRLFFEMMVKHHAKKIGTYENGQAKTVYRHKCLFLMDEFSSLGNLQSFAATLSYIAGYGMKVFLINQGLPQINGIYGKDNQILMNCHLQIFYSPNDNDTGKYAESLLGNKTILVESVSDSGFFSNKQYSKSATSRALMTADELKRLGDQEILIASGSPPILTDKVKYYENDFFLTKLKDAPAASDVIRDNPYPEREALLAGQQPKRKKQQQSPVWEEAKPVKKSAEPIWQEAAGREGEK